MVVCHYNLIFRQFFNEFVKNIVYILDYRVIIILIYFFSLIN